MKKLLSLSLISAVLCTALITLSACGQDNDPPEEENPPREEKAPPKEKEEETPPEEETQPEEEETPPKEEGTASQEPSCQEQLIGTWQLVGNWTAMDTYPIENGVNMTFKSDFTFHYSDPLETFFYHDTKRGNKNNEEGKYFFSEITEGRETFPLLNFRMKCHDKKLMGFTYIVSFEEGQLLLTPHPHSCDEGCTLLFKKVDEDKSE